MSISLSLSCTSKAFNKRKKQSNNINTLQEIKEIFFIKKGIENNITNIYLEYKQVFFVVSLHKLVCHIRGDW